MSDMWYVSCIKIWRDRSSNMSRTRLLKLKVILGGFFCPVSCRAFMQNRKSSSYTASGPKISVVAKVNANGYEGFLIMIGTYQDAFPGFFSPSELIK